MKDRIHRHGCVTCKKCYEDACDQPSGNARCYQCRAGRPGLYDQLGTFQPRTCCFTDCRPPKKNKLAGLDEFASYRMSSSIPWWICDTCRMTFPFRKPRKEIA